MSRIKLLFFTLALAITQLGFAQSVSVSGKVTDTNGEPIPGANVVVKGKDKGTATDFDGKYNLKVNVGDVLVFSSLGYDKVEKNVSGGGTINAVLKESTNQLDKVVITAMGMEKKEKALGYASQQVKVNDLKQVSQNALANLQGQISGVQITQSSGAVGGGVDILIRGVKSLDPSVSNQPLIVVDGVRINNDINTGNVKPSAGSNAQSSSEQFSFANRAIDINPDDIESINVLKGAAASALYGIDAANGVIVITTKKGYTGKPKYSFLVKTSISNPNAYMDLQDTYREGWAQIAGTTADPNNPNIRATQPYDYGDEKGYWLLDSYPKNWGFYSWGPKFSENTDPSIKFHDVYREFFRTGITNSINFQARGGKDKYSYYFSAGQNNNQGIVPNSYYNKTNLSLKANYKLTKKLNVGFSTMYNKSGGNLPNNGDRSSFSALAYFVPSFDVNDYKYKDGGMKIYTPKGWLDNPRYFAEESSFLSDLDRFIGSANAEWKANDKLNVKYTISLDRYLETRDRFMPPEVDQGKGVHGFVINEAFNVSEINSLLISTYKYELNKDMKFNFLVGNEITTNDRKYQLSRGEGLILPHFDNISNTENKFASNREIGKNRVGLFGEVDFAYKEKLFINLTGRNDWSSTLPKENRSFFYPSVNLSYILYDESETEDNKVLSFAKLRTSWANVGKDALPGYLGTRWYISDYPTNNGGNQGGIYPSTIEGDVNLKPENQRTFEVGFDLRFFDNRLRLDYTYYNNLNTDLLARIPVTPSSGLSSIYTNAGTIENIGHEILLKMNWLNKDDFNWSSTINWSTNKGTVTDLPKEISEIEYTSDGVISSKVKEGDELGTLYGYQNKYIDGKLVLGSNGYPLLDDSEMIIVGNAFPDWVGSLSNNIRYKNINLSFNIEYKKGGDAYDRGLIPAIRGGNLKRTADNRYQPVTFEGVDEDGNPVTSHVFYDESYYRNKGFYKVADNILQDASWLKLRNVTLSYSLPKSFANKIKANRVQLSFTGSNFIIWTPFIGFDPESNQYAAGSNAYGFTGRNVPITKNYTFGLKVDF